MASLSNWSLHDLTHRREIRSVASAFVGEIAAILHLIETHDVVSMVEKALDSSAVALPNLTLPAFTIYTADAARLDELPLPVPRKIAYFYAQIASIRDDLTRLATEPVSESSVGSRTERIRSVLTELNDALALGDDILRELRPLLSTKHQNSLTRAWAPGFFLTTLLGRELINAAGRAACESPLCPQQPTNHCIAAKRRDVPGPDLRCGA
jgi:hypothetical protein